MVGGIPSGINFNTSTRVISGTPTTVGSGTIRIRATNSEGSDDWTVAYTTAGVAAGPDLTVDTPTVNPTGVLIPGQSFTLTAIVRNQGTGASESTTLRWRMSTDATITSSDTQVGTDSVPGLGVGGTSSESISLTALTQGTYYYGATVDDVNGELDLSNNASGAVTIIVVEPTVTTDHAVNAGAASWAFALPQPMVTITAHVVNDHAVNAGNVSWAVAIPQPTVTHVAAGAPDFLTYLWTSNGGGVFANATLKDTTWTAPDVTLETVVTLTLLVTDSGGLTDTDSVDVTVQDVVGPRDHAVDAGDVTWAYALPQPTVTHTPATPVTTDHAVNAGAASWAFAIPQPTITHVVAGAPDFLTYLWTSNGGGAFANASLKDTTWTAPSVSQETVVTLTLLVTDSGGLTDTDSVNVTVRDTALPLDYAVNAGAASWAFALSQPTVTHTPVLLTAPSFADDTGISQAWTPSQAIIPITVPVASGFPTPTYAVQGFVPNGIGFTSATRVISGAPTSEGSGIIRIRATNSEGSDDWTVAYTIAVVATTVGIATLEIDFGNDGTFSHAAADVTGDLVRHSLRATRGRTLQSRRKATAGRLEAKLWNLAAKYDPINSSSPIYERDLTGVRVRMKIDGVVVWGGIMDTPRYRQRPVPQMDIIALGRLSTLRQPVSVAGQTSLTIGEVAKLVGDAVGFTTTYLTGGKTLNRWKGVTDQDALLVLQDLEEHEEGFLFERLDGELGLEAENARSTGDSATSALTLKDEIESATDVPILRGSGLDWGYRQIANVVLVPVETLEEAAEGILWRVPHDFEIGAGMTISILITIPNLYSTPNTRGVASWIEPVSGTDYTPITGLTVTGAVVGERYQLTLENTSSGTITVDRFSISVRGTALVAGDLIWVEGKDAASITRFGEREYARPSPLFTTIAEAQEYADGIVSRRSSPHGWLVARWPAYYAARQARTLDLSRRITVERLGETADYYIEGETIVLRGFVRMEYLLSPVPGLKVPSAPVVTLSQVAGQAAQLAVSWTEPFDGGSAITGYGVRYKRSSDSVWISSPHTGTGLTATITGLEQGGISYDVQVQATNIEGGSLWSVSRTGMTPSQAPYAPAAPTLIGGVGSLGVSWPAPYNGGFAITDYDVRYKKSTDSAWTSWAHTGTVRMATITGLSSLYDWDVQVQARNTQGSSAWSLSGTSTTTEAITLYGQRDKHLYTVDPFDASVTLVGSLGAAQYGSMSAVESALYVVNDQDDFLHSVNTETGASNFVSGMGSGTWAVASIGSVLYQVDYATGNLWRKATPGANAGFIGSLGAGRWEAMAAIGETIYVVNRFSSNPSSMSRLWSVDPSDASKTTVGDLARHRVRDMTAIGSDLYAIIENALYTIDPTDASVTLVGSLSGATWRGLAALIL